MKVRIAYGRNGMEVELPREATTVIEPRHEPVLPDERAAVQGALDHPLGCRPLREWIQKGQRLCIAFTDSTRATPNHLLIPWILEYLGWPEPERVLLLNQTGTHRPNSPWELQRMLGEPIISRYIVRNHEATREEDLVCTGVLPDGTPVMLHRGLVESDVRIITGFIEPHFFAGFSGGPKGIIPGCAGLRTVMSNHGSRNLSHPGATFGVTVGNPLWEELRDAALSLGASFLVNVTLNHEKRLTGVYAGDLVKAHAAGCERVKAASMRPVADPFDLVLTSNSGYPLDLNLYQGVKGICAAARIVRPGGVIILACECGEGVPDGSAFDRLLRSEAGPDAVLKKLASPGFCWPEQWQVQLLAQVQQRASVHVVSSLPVATLRALKIGACSSVETLVMSEQARVGLGFRMAVLPQGPLTIPYVER